MRFLSSIFLVVLFTTSLAFAGSTMPNYVVADKTLISKNDTCYSVTFQSHPNPYQALIERSDSHPIYKEIIRLNNKYSKVIIKNHVITDGKQFRGFPDLADQDLVLYESKEGPAPDYRKYVADITTINSSKYLRGTVVAFGGENKSQMLLIQIYFGVPSDSSPEDMRNLAYSGSRFLSENLTIGCD